MKQGRIIDLHCDTLLKLYLSGGTLREATGHINIAKLEQGGAQLQCFAAFLPTHEEAEESGIKETPYQMFLSVAEIFKREMAANACAIRPVRCMKEIEDNQKAGLISAMLTVEDAVLLEGDIDRLDELYSSGVRMITLTWNYENTLGYPNSPDAEHHRLRLKAFGREAVERMEELGIVVDVSHLSEGGFWDVADQMKKPFAASHSCARALCDHSRNLSDRQLRALADHGGVCGVNFYSKFLVEDSEHTKTEYIIRHMEHIANVAGIEAVALGSDFDGIDCSLELEDYTGMAQLIDAMSRRFSQADVDRICSGNAMRLLRDTVG